MLAHALRAPIRPIYYVCILGIRLWGDLIAFAAVRGRGFLPAAILRFIENCWRSSGASRPPNETDTTPAPFKWWKNRLYVPPRSKSPTKRGARVAGKGVNNSGSGVQPLAKSLTPPSSPVQQDQVQLHRRSRSQSTLQETPQRHAVSAIPSANGTLSPGCDPEGGAACDAVVSLACLRRRGSGASRSAGAPRSLADPPSLDKIATVDSSGSMSPGSDAAVAAASRPPCSFAAGLPGAAASDACMCSSESDGPAGETGPGREPSFTVADDSAHPESEPATELRLPAGRPKCRPDEASLPRGAACGAPFAGGQVLARAEGRRRNSSGAAARLDYTMLASVGGHDAAKTPASMAAVTGVQASTCLTPARDQATGPPPASATPSTGTPPTDHSLAKAAVHATGQPGWSFDTPQRAAASVDTPSGGGPVTAGSLDFSPHLPLPSATLLTHDSPSASDDCSSGDSGHHHSDTTVPQCALLAARTSPSTIVGATGCGDADGDWHTEPSQVTAGPPRQADTAAVARNVPEPAQTRTPLGQMKTPLSSNNAAAWAAYDQVAGAKAVEGAGSVAGAATQRSVGGGQRRPFPATPVTSAAPAAAMTPGSVVSGAASASRPSRSSVSRRASVGSGECSSGGGVTSSASKTPRYLQSTRSWALKHG